jgi:hypothetical protein
MAAEDRKQDVIEHQLRIVAHGVWQTCLNCDNWSWNDALRRGFATRPPPSCLRFSSLPPPDVLVVGCQEWTPDVPF